MHYLEARLAAATGDEGLRLHRTVQLGCSGDGDSAVLESATRTLQSWARRVAASGSPSSRAASVRIRVLRGSEPDGEAAAAQHAAAFASLGGSLQRLVLSVSCELAPHVAG